MFGKSNSSPINHHRFMKFLVVCLTLLLCMPTASFGLEPNVTSDNSSSALNDMSGEDITEKSMEGTNASCSVEEQQDVDLRPNLDSSVLDDESNGTTQEQEQSNTATPLVAAPLSLELKYDATNLKCGTPVTFTMQGSGGSGKYKYLQNYIHVDLNGYPTDDADWSRMSYTEGNTFTYTFVASGTYTMRLYAMDVGSQPYQTTRIERTFTINDSRYPSVDQIATSIAKDCLAQGYVTDYEKALYVHDRIINNATYDHSLLYDGESGVLARGTGTCESYHRAFSLIMGKLGIPCERATGNGHVWSCVKLDGQWTQIDLTWDGEEQKSEYAYLRHLYFGLTDDLMETAHNEHAANNDRLCSTYQSNYFLRSGEIKRWSDPIKEQIATQLSLGKIEFTIPASYNIYPSVYDILYPLVAQQLMREDWGLEGSNIKVVFVKTSLNDGYYSVCNHNDSSAQWQHNSSSHWITCSVCGLKCADDHNYDAWHFDSGKHLRTCSVCGYIETSEAHVYKSWQHNANQHWKACALCGQKENMGNHSFGAWRSDAKQHWKLCSVCNAKGNVGNHSYGTWQKNSKQHWRFCTTCNAKENAVNHNYGSWKTTKNPTATNTGIKERTCKTCGFKETQSIPATGVVVKPGTNVPAQTIMPGTYIVKTSLNTARVVDIASASKSNGGNTQIYQNNNTAAQRFRISYDSLTGFYTIINLNSGKVLDVSGAKAANGTNVQQYQSNGTLAQRWVITGDSRMGYTIASALNRSYVLDVAGASNRNGANVQIYRSNNTKAQKFFFARTDAGKTIDNGMFVLEAGVTSSKAIDISGASSRNGANAQIYSKNGTAAQKFRITFDPSTNYYVITNVGSGKVLDVSGAKAANGTNVQQYQSNGTLAQRWAITGSNSNGYTIASAIDRSYVLDVAGASQKNGANVQIYRSNNTKAQKFYLRKL